MMKRSDQKRTTVQQKLPMLLPRGIFVVYSDAVVLGLVPSNFLSQVLDQLTEWTRQFGL